MNRLSQISEEITRTLSLRYKPAGVMLYDNLEQVDPALEWCPRDLKSYCQALVLAGEGQTLLLKKEQMGCKLGTSVLGFENETDMARYLDDGVLEKYGVGLFGTEAASAETILNSTYLDKGATQACLVAPLDRFDQDPQVVVFTADSEQVMWLLYALNYDKGGKMELPQSGGALGGCADITALPIMTGQPDITFLGLGCRLKSAIGPGDLMLGIAGKDLETVHRHVLDMKKPIAMLQKLRQ